MLGRQLRGVGEGRGQLAGLLVGYRGPRELEVDPADRVFELDQEAELAVGVGAERQVAGMGLEQVDVAGNRFGAVDRVGDGVMGRQERRGRDGAADLCRVGAGDRFGVVVVDLVAGRVGGEIRAGAESVGGRRADAEAGRQLDSDVLGLGGLGKRGVEGGAEVGRIVGLGEVEVDREAGGLVGLQRPTALQRSGGEGRVELGGEGRFSRSR